MSDVHLEWNGVEVKRVGGVEVSPHTFHYFISETAGECGSVRAHYFIRWGGVEKETSSFLMHLMQKSEAQCPSDRPAV